MAKGSPKAKASHGCLKMGLFDCFITEWLPSRRMRTPQNEAEFNKRTPNCQSVDENPQKRAESDRLAEAQWLLEEA